MNLYEMACNVMNLRGLRQRASSCTITRIIDRWEIVYSEHLGQHGNPEREGWVYIERIDDYVPEDEVVSCALCTDAEHEDRACNIRVFGARSSYTERWCERCADMDAVECANCSERIASENAEHNEDDNESYCPDCYAEAQRVAAESTDVRDYHSTRRPSASSYEPMWSIEIEMEFASKETREAFAKEAFALPWQGENRLIIETDGSLDRQKGVECILSCYASKEALLSDIHALQACAKRHKALAWDLPKIHGRAAGIHISTNRLRWTTHALMRLGYILTLCAEALKKAAGREVHFAAYPERAYSADSRNLKYFARGVMGKYSAVNLQSSRLEWRIFRSTLNPDRITHNLNLVCNLEALAKSKTPAVALKAAALAIINSHTL